VTATSTDDRAALGQALTEALHTVLEAFYGSGGDAALLGEVLVGVGILQQATDMLSGAPYWLADGEPTMADAYEPEGLPEHAEPLYRIGAPS
jgi:hypothetical protein